jgi:hypothetical protein
VEHDLSIRGKRSVGRQEMEMAMPVQLGAKGLKESNQGRATVGSDFPVTERQGKRLMSCGNQVREELSVVEKVGS